MDPKFLTFIDRAIEQFSQLENEDDKWQLANDLVIEVGGNALNVAVSTRSKTITWARSSMKQNWLDDYMDEGLFVSDPFIKSMGIANNFTSLFAGSLSAKDTNDRKLLDLNHGLIEPGYNSLFGLSFTGALGNQTKLVVIASELSSQEFQQNLPINHLRLLASIISANIAVPMNEAVGGVFSFGKKTITAKEKEVFSWLAVGLRNDAIADKLNIAEITVRKHIISARKKLNASTREQALAIAICDGHIQL